MKNFYNISVAQLITIWVFAGLGWCWSAIEVLDSYNPPFLAGFFGLFIPFALIFYSLGWWKHYENNKGN